MPFRGQELILDLSVERSIFAGDFQVIDDMTGKSTAVDTKGSTCHYTGTVRGDEEGSRVTLSVCNTGGINGLISTPQVDAEILPVDPNAGVSSLGEHIIYDMEDLILPDDISFGEAVAGVEDFAVGALNDTDIGSSRAYVISTAAYFPTSSTPPLPSLKVPKKSAINPLN